MGEQIVAYLKWVAVWVFLFFLFKNEIAGLLWISFTNCSFLVTTVNDPDRNVCVTFCSLLLFRSSNAVLETSY